MSLTRTKIGKILVSVLVSFLLCGIVAAEFPELLSLTDNSANDFTLSKAKTVALRALPGASRYVRITDIDFNIPAPALLLSHLSSFEKAALPFSELSILHSILRT
jgi:hypothetical protein